jgi:hypothetical protein
MSQAVQLQTAPAKWPLGPLSLDDANSAGLADILLRIQQKRGALYMLETSRYVIEKWDLRSDQLRAQSDETLALVARLLML